MNKEGSKVILAAALVLIMTVNATPAQAGCGDFNEDGSVSATDALGILVSGVGANTCPKARCDTDDNGSVAATDALRVLQKATGQFIVMACPGVAVTSIDQLPRATSAVLPDGVGASALVVSNSAVVGTPYGLKLSELSTTFDSTSSIAACQIADMTRTAVEAAASADQILCYIQNAFQGIVVAGGGVVDIYDGQYHLFALDFGSVPQGSGGPEGGPSLIKMKLEKTGDTLTGFELFACEDGANGPVQQEYIRQTILSTDFSMVAKGNAHGPWGNDSHQVVVDGDLNDDGNFIGTKTITTSHSSTMSDGSTSGGQMVVAQGASALDLEGFDGGNFTVGTEEMIFANRVTSNAELVDFNTPGTTYQIGQLALGHGAAKMSMRNGTRLQWSDFTQVEGWNAETTQVDLATASTFIDTVLDATLPEISDIVITFDPSQQFDCTGTPEASIPIDQLQLDQACSALDLGHEWLDCWSLINGGGGPGGGNQPPVCDGPDCSCQAADTCGGQTPGGCFCDPDCVNAGDCCPDACDVCGQCGPPNGGCDPAVDPNCPSGFCGDGLCDNSMGEDGWNCPNDCGPPCDPATDPNCFGPCDPATDPNCFPPCNPATDPSCAPSGPCDGPDCTCTLEPTCGEQAPGGCFCDPGCVAAGDCCVDACNVCGSCP